MSQNPLEIFARLFGRSLLNRLAEAGVIEDLEEAGERERDHRRRMRSRGYGGRPMYQKPPKTPKAPRPPTPREVLGVSPRASLDLCELMYRARAKKEHPDVGGDPDNWARVTAAINTIRGSGR